MNTTVQKKWRDCTRCGKGFRHPISQPATNLCPNCRAPASDWDSSENYTPPATQTLRPKWTIESALREKASREGKS